MESLLIFFSLFAQRCGIMGGKKKGDEEDF